LKATPILKGSQVNFSFIFSLQDSGKVIVILFSCLPISKSKSIFKFLASLTSFLIASNSFTVALN